MAMNGLNHLEGQTVAILADGNDDEFCHWKNGIQFQSEALGVSQGKGSWASGVYRMPDGSLRCCTVISFVDDPAPSLWTRIRMRLQGWKWIPAPRHEL
jgi:hypothetical protein